MSDNILNFPTKEKVDADTILQEAIGKYENCIVIGITKDGQAEYSICAEDPEQVVYLIRVLEHLLIAQELT